MKDVVIINGSRTAIGAYGGSLNSTPVVDLGAAALKGTVLTAGLRPGADEQCIKFAADSIRGDGQIELERRYYDYDDTLQPVEIDQVIMGNVLGAGQGQNVARQAMIKAGIPKETSATAINKLCALSHQRAVAAIACIRELGCNITKTNTLGSGISLGHPIGCTGARILVTLMHQMKRENQTLDLASLCIGGGQGMAMVLENASA